MKIEKLPSGSYRIRKTINKKTYAITLDHKPTKSEAENLIWEKIQAKSSKPKKDMTLSEACEHYNEIMSGSLSPSTIKGYETCRRNLPGWILEMKISEIKKPELQKLINEMSQKLKPKTVKNRYGYVHSTLSMFLSDFKETASTPRIENSNLYIPTSDDIKSLYNEIKGSRYEIAIHLATLGLRRSEIVALSKDDLDGNILHINKSMVQDKDGKWIIRKLNKTKSSTRDILIPDYLRDMINSRPVIYDGDPDSIWDYLDAALKRLDIPHFSLHKLRHYYASFSHEIGIPEAQIMKAGGWSSPEVLRKVYRHALDDTTQKFQEKATNYLESLYQNS